MLLYPLFIVSTFWTGDDASEGGKIAGNSRGNVVIASDQRMKNLLDGIFGRGYEV
jgi:hypothetical protein